MKKTVHIWILLQLIVIPSLCAGNILINGGFENLEFEPWYQDRFFGSYRSWGIGTHDPAEGQQNAFCLGRVELRQDFTPVPANRIGQLTFKARQQFAGRGPMWAELFYGDGTSTGFMEIELEGDFDWQTIDLLPFLDQSKMVSGVSVFGIPDNTLVVDDFRVVVDAKLLTIKHSDNSATLSWFGRQGYVYQLLRSSDLRTWSLEEEIGVIMPGTLSHEWQLDQDRAFFRLNIIEAGSEQTSAGDVFEAAPGE